MMFAPSARTAGSAHATPRRAATDTAARTAAETVGDETAEGTVPAWQTQGEHGLLVGMVALRRIHDCPASPRERLSGDIEPPPAPPHNRERALRRVPSTD